MRCARPVREAEGETSYALSGPGTKMRLSSSRDALMADATRMGPTIDIPDVPLRQVTNLKWQVTLLFN